jgi:hypothetical protein
VTLSVEAPDIRLEGADATWEVDDITSSLDFVSQYHDKDAEGAAIASDLGSGILYGKWRVNPLASDQVSVSLNGDVIKALNASRGKEFGIVVVLKW